MRQLGQIRTTEQEFLVQEGTPEQQEWSYLHARQKNYVAYAEACARAFLAQLEASAAKHGNAAVRGLCKDRLYVRGVMEHGYCVENSQVEYACELVARCGERRFP